MYNQSRLFLANFDSYRTEMGKHQVPVSSICKCGERTQIRTRVSRFISASALENDCRVEMLLNTPPYCTSFRNQLKRRCMSFNDRFLKDLSKTEDQKFNSYSKFTYFIQGTHFERLIIYIRSKIT